MHDLLENIKKMMQLKYAVIKSNADKYGYKINRNLIGCLLHNNINLNNLKILCLYEGDGILASGIHLFWDNCFTYQLDTTYYPHKRITKKEMKKNNCIDYFDYMEEKVKQNDVAKNIKNNILAKELGVENKTCLLHGDIYDYNVLSLLYNLDIDLIISVRGCGQLTDIAMELAFKKKIPLIYTLCLCDAQYPYCKSYNRNLDVCNGMRLQRIIDNNFVYRHYIYRNSNIYAISLDKAENKEERFSYKYELIANNRDIWRKYTDISQEIIKEILQLYNNVNYL